MQAITFKKYFSIMAAILVTLLLILLAGNIIASQAHGTDSTFIIFKPGKNTAYDSVQIDYWKDYIEGTQTLLLTRSSSFRMENTGPFVVSETSEHGIFNFRIYQGENIQYHSYLPVNKGDQITIEINKDKLLFSGNGSTKVKLAYELKEMHDKYRKEYYDNAGSRGSASYSTDTFWGAAYSFFQLPLDSLLGEKLKYLDRFKKNLNKEDYLRLKASVIAYDYFRRFNTFGQDKTFGLAKDSSKREIFRDLYNKHLASLEIKGIPDSILAYTPFYIDNLRSGYIQEKSLNNPDKKHMSMISYSQQFSDVVRDNLITEHLMIGGINKADHATVRESISQIRSPLLIGALSGLLSRIKTNEAAYDFVLEDTQGKVVRLGDFKGKVVFLDFWFTGCKWCKIYYANTLREVEQYFRSNDKIVFISVCVDSRKETWLNSIEEKVYTDPEAINLYTQGLGLRHKVLRHYNITGFPAQIVIDQNLKNYNVDKGIQRLSAPELVDYLQSVISGVDHTAEATEK